MSHKTFPTCLTILRAIRGVSQGELARIAGVTNSAISDYERGKVDPQAETLRRIVAALGCGLGALDRTEAFVLLVRAEMDAGMASDLPLPDRLSSEEERARLVTISELSTEGGRFAARFVRLLLELISERPTP